MLKLNVGCGGKRIDGYIGIDAVERPGADYVAPAHELPFDDGQAEEVMAIHLVEHLLPWEVPIALTEWHRVLKDGGKLVLEMPDLIKCCRNIVEGRGKNGKHPDQLGMWGLFGDNRLEDSYMLHRWAWTFETLHPLVAKAGFRMIKEVQTMWHPVGRFERDFRLEAVK